MEILLRFRTHLQIFSIVFNLELFFYPDIFTLSKIFSFLFCMSRCFLFYEYQVSVIFTIFKVVAASSCLRHLLFIDLKLILRPFICSIMEFIVV